MLGCGEISNGKIKKKSKKKYNLIGYVTQNKNSSTRKTTKQRESQPN